MIKSRTPSAYASKRCTPRTALGGGGICRVRDLRAAGTAVGLGCDGWASNDIASLWLEARTALLLARQRSGPTGMTARQVLEIATRGGAACLGRVGEIGQLTPGTPPSAAACSSSDAPAVAP